MDSDLKEQFLGHIRSAYGEPLRAACEKVFAEEQSEGKTMFSPADVMRKARERCYTYSADAAAKEDEVPFCSDDDL